MPYAEGRVIHDADSHIVETPDFFIAYADPDLRARMEQIFVATVRPGEERMIGRARERQTDPAWRAEDESQILLRKNWDALGSFIAADRPQALDILGFSSQLVFNTFANKALQRAEHRDDTPYAHGLARAHNRAIVDFCSVDPRLLPVGYVPLCDVDTAPAFAAEALDLGCKALMIASACPPTHSPSHIGLDGVWARAQEAGVPIVFHVGGGGRLLDPNYFENGLPPVLDFHGGAENFRSVDYMAIPYPPMQTLATLLFDGVLERFPDLKWGVIEQGASWLPGWMRGMESAVDAFAKNEERLRNLSLRPSEYVRRQVRVTPYPAEETGWIVEQAGPEVCLFSSDYPHVEGGRNPIARFERALGDASEAVRQRFYCDNFEDLMGPALTA